MPQRQLPLADGRRGVSRMQRRGRVLALLTRLKQICNHPEQVRPTGAALGGRSGKLDRTTEILSEIVDSGDRALVFTQYRKTGELLAHHLGNEVTAGVVGVPARRPAHQCT